MSGSIRRYIGPAKARLKDYIQTFEAEAEAWNKEQFDLHHLTDEQYSKMTAFRDQMKMIQMKIQKTYDQLLSKDSEWTKLIEITLKDDLEARKREAEEYSKVVEGDDGLINLFLKADETQARLEVNIQKIQSLLKKIEKIEASSISSNTGSVHPEEKEESDTSRSNVTPPPALEGDEEIDRTPVSAQRRYHISSRQIAPQVPTEVPIAGIPQPEVIDINLPKFEMTKYDGDPTKWTSFWDLFNSSVHSKSNLSNALKFTYLKGFLTGSAAKAIAGITISNQNYAEAVQILKERFGDTEVVKESLWNQLREMSHYKSQSLANTVDSVEEIIRQLKALGEDTRHPYFCQMVQQVLPLGTMAQVESKRASGIPWQMDTLLRALRDIIKTQTRIERYEKELHPVMFRFPQPPQKNRDQQSNSQRQPYSPRSSEQPRATTEAFGANVREHQHWHQQMRPCVFCNKLGHYNENCDVYPQPQRKKRADELKLCMLCLKKAHAKKDCRYQTRICVHCGEENSHNRALCHFLRHKPFTSQAPKPGKTQSAVGLIPSNGNGEEKEEPQRDTKSKLSSTSGNAGVIESKEGQPAISADAEAGNQEAMLLLAKVFIRNPEEPEKIVEARVFLDTGGQRTFIKESLAEQLNLTKTTDPISLHRIASKRAENIDSDSVIFEIFCRDGTSINVKANTLPFLTKRIVRHPLSEADIKYLKSVPESHLADEKPLQRRENQPDILIGINYFWHFILPQQIIQLPSGLFLIPSKLGLLLGGEMEGFNNPKSQLTTSNSFVLCAETLVNSAVPALCLHTKADEVLTSTKIPNIEEWWSLESIGIKDNPDEKDEDKALELFNSKVRISEDGRFEVGFPWKQTNPELPENYGLALGRFKSQMRRFKEDPELLKKCNEIIQDQLQKDVIEIVPKDNAPSSVIHYLPHQAVVTPQRHTTKVRLVFDASSKTKQSLHSLNDCLYPGPVILPDLTGMLFRFRFHPVVITADIEKAFLQIKIREEDKDSTRFLWFRDGRIPEIEDNLMLYRFNRVLFGMNCSPFLLAACIKFLLQTSDSSAAEKLMRNMYVDNAMIGVNSTEEATEMYKESKSLFATVKLNLREYNSNDQKFMMQIPVEDQYQGKKSKILGVPWNTKDDTMGVEGPTQEKILNPITKRSVLQYIASIFDPMGFMSPVVLKGKLFIQSLWRDKKDWDEQLTPEKNIQWSIIQPDFALISSCSVSRFLGIQPENTNLLQLHVFVDASVKAYALAAYLVIPNLAAHLVFSKTRLAPVNKNLSLPRLELLALVLGTRAAKFLQHEAEFPIKKVFVWSDSQCCLHWLKSVKPLSVFVENRVKQIKACNNVTFQFVPTDHNPADCATRGLSAADLLSHSLWWEGPPWLKFERSRWPKWDADPTEEIEVQLQQELNKSKQRKQRIEIGMMEILKKKNIPSAWTNVIDITRFSSLEKLERVTVLSFRFLKKILKLSTEKLEQHDCLQRIFKPVLAPSTPMNATELTTAKLWWIFNIQRENFSDCISAVNENKKQYLKDQLGLKLNKDNLLECHGRIENSDLPNATKCPIILPSKDYYTALLIMNQHVKLQHVGTAHTLSAIRENYWIPKGRATVRRIIKNCYICVRFKSQPFERPPMAQLPADRVIKDRPFNKVGLDYLGPLYSKFSTEVIKVWMCIFTCMVTRAIHLEVVSSLSAEQFLGCLRKFIARRGCPEVIVCDNAAQFQATSTLISEVWSAQFYSDEVYNYCAAKRITWKFISPLSPWKGGFYERLIQIVKSCMKKAIGKKLLTFEELEIFTAETEGCLNSRPLTFVYSEFESKNILRPIDFLSPYGKVGSPNIRDPDDEIDPLYDPNSSSQIKLKRLWEKSQICLDRFWKFFYAEYLPSLRETQKLKHKDPRCRTKREPEINEIVIIQDPFLPRGSWKLGKVISLNPGADGFIRSVKLLLPNRKKIIRPVNLLHPLEISTLTENTEEGATQKEKENLDQHQSKKMDPVNRYNLRPQKAVKYKEESDSDN